MPDAPIVKKPTFRAWLAQDRPDAFKARLRRGTLDLGSTADFITA